MAAIRYVTQARTGVEDTPHRSRGQLPLGYCPRGALRRRSASDGSKEPEATHPIVEALEAPDWRSATTSEKVTSDAPA